MRFDHLVDETVQDRGDDLQRLRLGVFPEGLVAERLAQQGTMPLPRRQGEIPTKNARLCAVPPLNRGLMLVPAGSDNPRMTEDHRGRQNTRAYGPTPAPKHVRRSESFPPSGSLAESSFDQSFIDSRGEPTALPLHRSGRNGRSGLFVAIAVLIGLAALGLYGLARLLRG